MKILIIARGIPNSHDPQEGCFEWDQAKALAERGHTVVVMAVDSRVRKYWRKIGITKTEKQDVTSYKLFLFPSSIIRHLISVKLGYKLEAYLAKRLFKYVRKIHGDFDIVHSHFLQCTYYASVIKHKYGCKTVATEHWSELDKPDITPLVRYLGDISYPKVDRLISVSESLAVSIHKNFNIDSLVIHNLINSKFTDTLSYNKGKRQGFVFTCVGSLIRRKGFDRLINAFYKSKARNMGAQIIIIGSGSERQNLEKQIYKLNLSNQVHLLGQKNKSEIFDYLQSSDAFILPSRHENFSVSVLEAMSCGNPVIATICGGIKECINSSNGLLVGVDDEVQLTKALDYMYFNISKYDRDEIRKNCISKYSPESIVRQLESIYVELINSH